MKNYVVWSVEGILCINLPNGNYFEICNDLIYLDSAEVEEDGLLASEVLKNPYATILYVRGKL